MRLIHIDFFNKKEKGSKALLHVFSSGFNERNYWGRTMSPTANPLPETAVALAALSST